MRNHRNHLNPLFLAPALRTQPADTDLQLSPCLNAKPRIRVHSMLNPQAQALPNIIPLLEPTRQSRDSRRQMQTLWNDRSRKLSLRVNFSVLRLFRLCLARLWDSDDEGEER